MNQAEAASVLGCSEAHISRIASGQRAPSPELMVRIERHFRWELAAQVSSLNEGGYWAEFKARMGRVLARETT